jgi:hypothetical protein
MSDSVTNIADELKARAEALKMELAEIEDACNRALPLAQRLGLEAVVEVLRQLRADVAGDREQLGGDCAAHSPDERAPAHHG